MLKLRVVRGKTVTAPRTTGLPSESSLAPALHPDIGRVFAAYGVTSSGLDGEQAETF